MIGPMIDPSVKQQLWQMLQMFLCGWVLMLSAHEKQIVMKVAQWSYRRRMIGDFVFYVVWALFLWLVLVMVSGGLVRNYIVFGFVSGIAIYQLLFRRLLEQLCRAIAKAVLFVWQWFWRIVLFPWRVVKRQLFAPCARAVKKLVRTFAAKRKQSAAVDEAFEETFIEPENEDIFSK